MGSAIALGDIVGIAKNRFLIRVVPLQGEFKQDSIAFGTDIAGCWVQRAFLAAKMCHKSFDTPFVLEDIFGVSAFIYQTVAYTQIQKRQLSQAPRQDIVVHDRICKNLRIRPKMYFGAGPISITDH